jgi:hypothetical protein
MNLRLQIYHLFAFKTVPLRQHCLVFASGLVPPVLEMVGDDLLFGRSRSVYFAAQFTTREFHSEREVAKILFVLC